jgi:hypothetical protein
MPDEPDDLADAHTWTTDAFGNRVLIGLTPQETQELLELRRRWWKRQLSKAARLRMRELTDKHERERLQVIGAEIAIRTYKPKIN